MKGGKELPHLVLYYQTQKQFELSYTPSLFPLSEPTNMQRVLFSSGTDGSLGSKECLLSENLLQDTTMLQNNASCFTNAINASSVESQYSGTPL